MLIMADTRMVLFKTTFVLEYGKTPILVAVSGAPTQEEAIAELETPA